MHSYKLIVLLITLVTLDRALGMTRVQLKKTLGLMKKSCMQKNGATEDKVANIEAGEFIEDRSVMCYITCIYQSVQVIKNNRLDKNLIFKQVDTLYPQDMKAGAKSAAEKCNNVQDSYSDLCEGVFHSIKCFYEQDPPNFVFP